MDKLADEEFWNDYWTHLELPSQINPNFSFDRCIDRALSPHLRGLPAGSTLFEVGCAPGRWLAYFSKKFGLDVSGIDYSGLGVKKTHENLAILGVKGSIIHQDFFAYKPSKKYDVVVSFGFIEHFDNADLVVKKHLDLLKPGGLLILGIPNFRGVYEPVQALYWPQLLKKHNLGIMEPAFFRRLAEKNGLEVLACGYVGGFEPTLFVKPPRVGLLRNLLIRAPLAVLRRVRSLQLFDGINHPFFSSYILAVMRSPPK